MREMLMKYKIEKNTVQETLIIPLYSRKLCSELYPNIYRDETAVRLHHAVVHRIGDKRDRLRLREPLRPAKSVKRRRVRIRPLPHEAAPEQNRLGKPLPLQDLRRRDRTRLVAFGKHDAPHPGPRPLPYPFHHAHAAPPYSPMSPKPCHTSRPV